MIFRIPDIYTASIVAWWRVDLRALTRIGYRAASDNPLTLKPREAPSTRLPHRW